MGGLGSLRNIVRKTRFRITQTVHHRHSPYVLGCNMFNKRNKDGFIQRETTKRKERKLL